MIELQRLRKTYNHIVAVNNASFCIKKGEVVGFLGPNGSGKSTTMRMITGYLQPDDGSVSICGIDVLNNPIEAQKHIGYLPEGAPAYGDLTVISYLNFIANARLLSKDEAHQAINHAANRTNIKHVLHQRIDTISKGYKRRVGLAQAILHNPDVLILDEPTDGLDPNQKADIHSLICEISQEKAIIISTHILEEVEAICTRAIIIADGNIVADENTKKLQKKGTSFNETFKNLTSKAADITTKENITEISSAQSSTSQTKPLSINHSRRVAYSFFRQVLSVLKKEFFTYFVTPTAYVIMSIFVGLSSSLTFFLSGFFIQNQASLEAFFQFHPWLFLFLIPAISMRLWSEERNSSSIELLLTLPMSSYAIVLGKFFAAWTIIGICLILTMPMWLTVNYLGAPDNNIIAIGYLGSFLMAGAYLSIGACMSTLSKNQIIAFILSALVCLVFIANGLSLVQEIFNDWAPSFVLHAINNMSFLKHFQTIVRGVVDLSNVVFFSTTILFFLLANVIAVEYARVK